MTSARVLPDRTLSRTINGPDGQPAVKIDALTVRAGQRVRLTFEAVGGGWRQGIFIATDGELVAAGTKSSSLVLWSDTSPPTSTIDVTATAGRLVLYNVWDSGRGLRAFESQAATSGMIVEELPDGTRRYSCTDMGTEPDFSRLVFRIALD